jgi:glyoxylase-like metal-dependent hydrolase (beta-lactamase superfamily II)
MRRMAGIVVTAAVLGLLILLPAAAQTSAPAGGRRIGPFAVDMLAEGIYLVRPVDPGSERTNSLVVERDDGLLVVDAQPSPAAAKELLQALAQLTPKPVRFLVLSHPHADAAGGASAFPRDVLVIGTQGCRDALADAGYDFGAEAKARAGNEWKEPQRRLPTAIPAGTLLLDDPRHPVRISPLPGMPAHSSGDLVVSIPDSGVIAIGDLLFPSRALWTKGGNLGNWIGILNGLLEEQPKIVAPLRGPAGDTREMRLTRDAVAWVRGQVQEAFVDRLAPGIMPDRILESPDLARYFDPGVPRPTVRALIEQSVREVQEFRKKHGLG